jgi:Kef-type K+ transport system membrane component KefB
LICAFVFIYLCFCFYFDWVKAMNVFLAAATGQTAEILLQLFMMLAAAKIMAEIFERLRQPAVVGEILAGVLIGGSVLAWTAPSDFTNTLAEIGVIFLLFTVGLETKPSAIFKVGKTAAIVAVLGVVVPFVCGYLLMLAWGGGNVQALFLGTALVATSIGITARVLSAMGLLDAPTSRIILGAAVIDDILGLLILAIVSSAAAGKIDYVEIITTAALSIGFTVAVALVGSKVLTRLAPRIEALRVVDSLFVFGLILCLGLSVAAAYIGVAAIIGAFLAGMALAEASEGHHEMHRQTSAVTEFLVPFFLVNIGMQLKLSALIEPSVLIFAVIVTVVAVLTKFVGCGLGAWGLGWRRMGQVGMGMAPRGEVGIVVAQIGLGLAVIDDALYGVVLFMAIATTLIAPPFLKWLFAAEAAAGGKIDTDDAGGIIARDEFCKIG